MTQEEKDKALELAQKYQTDKVSEKQMNKAFSLISKLDPDIARDVFDLFYMFKDAINGKYKLDKVTLFKIGGAIIYLITPIDAIPDFILLLGFLDDVVVLKFLIDSLKAEIERYRAFKSQNI